MPRTAQAQAWWADVDEVRERIERRRAAEETRRRGVRELSRTPRMTPVTGLAPEDGVGRRERSRRRPRQSAAKRLGPRPDLVAAWAVWMGLVLILMAVVSAHG